MALQSLLKEVFDVKENTLKDDSALRHLDFYDSMRHMIFITRLEETYEISLDAEEILSIETVGDIKRVLQSKGKEA